MYWDEAIKLENLFIEYLTQERFAEFENLLQKRGEFYKGYSEKNPTELKKFLNSSAYKDIQNDIQKVYTIKKQEIQKQIKDLATLKRANNQYKNNSYNNINFISKKI